MDINLSSTRVYRITWTEHERGWGQRPDGATLHSSLQEAKDYITQHWEREHERNGNRVPDEYSRPDRDPNNGDKIDLVEVSGEVYAKVMERGTIWE